MTAVEQGSELCRLVSTDGKEYVVAPCIWSHQKAAEYWLRRSRHSLNSDDVPDTIDGFEMYVSQTPAWWEIICLTDHDVVGLLCLTNLTYSGIAERFISAVFHGEIWDGKVKHRVPVLRESIRVLFNRLRLHKMSIEIPVKFKGAIRVSIKQLGFTPEGRLREARRYKGQWYDVLVMSKLESEL